MNDSFTSSSTLHCSTMKTTKYPANNTPPNDSWTIEQLLHWSLDQYHSAAIQRTNCHLKSLQSQCENECEDIMTLHELAVQMKERGELKQEDEEGDEEGVMAAAAEENADPQQITESTAATDQLKPSAAAATSSSAQSITTTTTTTKKTLLQITILSGPHESQTFQLQPKSNNNTQSSSCCLIGRSKGKKFLRNGISLNKDQEVSTTHGKFSMEEVLVDNGGTDGVQNKFYYTDVGSTNGSTVGDNVRLEPNVRMEIEEGMVLRIGNSTLKIEFG